MAAYATLIIIQYDVVIPSMKRSPCTSSYKNVKLC
jgi:hypothetical protein